MYRITKILEDKYVTIIKLEGEIAKADPDCFKIIEAALNENRSMIVLDLSDAVIDEETTLKLGSFPHKNLRVMNCTNFTMNLFNAAGLSEIILQ